MRHIRLFRTIQMVIAMVFCANAYANILFVSDAYSGPSEIAYQIARYFLYEPAVSRGLEVESATLEPYAKEALMEWNIDAPNTPRALTEADIASAQQVLVMTSKQLKALNALYPQYRNKIHLLSSCAGYSDVDVVNPNGCSLKCYQNLRDQIYTYEQVISANGWVCAH